MLLRNKYHITMLPFVDETTSMTNVKLT